ncbi:hypothetical protein PSHT_13481 [Puccinia striiformis]|uniref:Uncharacterized protein n=1 Tax=Puccinia striiformis TaxID=27350 RepID=A0A2S4UQP2_9BASI|nr:hypothetical protein PSHT_13481 [Puccinia striiformis]
MLQSSKFLKDICKYRIDLQSLFHSRNNSPLEIYERKLIPNEQKKLEILRKLLHGACMNVMAEYFRDVFDDQHYRLDQLTMHKLEYIRKTHDYHPHGSCWLEELKLILGDQEFKNKLDNFDKYKNSEDAWFLKEIFF